MIEVCIDEVTDFVLDGTHGSPIRTDTGIPVLSAQNVKDGKLSFDTDRYTSPAEYENFNRRLQVRSGDLLLTIVGTIGRVAVIDEVRPLVFQRSVAVLRPNSAKLSSRFLFHASRAPDFQAQLLRSSNQSSQAGVYLGKLKKVHMPLPPLAEQRRIAEILDKADALRTKRRAALAQLDALTQSIFLDTFGDAIALGWRMAKVRDVAEPTAGSIRTGPFGSQLLHGEFTSSGVAVLGIDNVVANEFRWGELRFISKTKYSQFRRYTVRPGDVLITIMGTCGRCAVVPDDIPSAINTKHLCCITVDRTKCLPGFLHAYFLRHPLAARYLRQNVKGAIMSGLNMGIIEAMPIPMPPIDIQRSFDARVTALERLRVTFRTALADLDALFASLQHRAFRGEL